MNRQQELALGIAHQTEALAIAEVALATLRESVRRSVEVHAALERIKEELVEANRQVSGPQYVPAAVAS